MTALAFDIGGTKVLAALVEQHRVVERAVIASDLADGMDVLLERAAALATPWAGRYRAVGVAVTGVVRDGKWRALNPHTLAIPGGFPLDARLEALLGRSVHSVNDAQAAALGEHVAGAGRGLSDMVFLTVSTGLGGGIIASGRLLGGLAGSFGQFLTDAGGRFEDEASGHWMAAAAAAAGHAADAAEVFARAGEPWAALIIDAAVERLARLLSNIQLAVDPERIIIGGGIGLAPGFIERLATALAPVDPDLRPRLVAAGLGADAGVVGAAALASQRSTNTRERENTS